jgi:hypothetical protein
MKTHYEISVGFCGPNDTQVFARVINTRMKETGILLVDSTLEGLMKRVTVWIDSHPTV